MTHSTAESIGILKAVNLVDSGLFGVSIDIFKVKLLISCQLSYDLARYDLCEDSPLSFEFGAVSSFLFSIHKGVFGPPYLEDGKLSAIDLADFDIEQADVRNVGKASPPTYRDGYELLDQYEVQFPFRSTGSLQFRFCTLSVETFDPEALDASRTHFY